MRLKDVCITIAVCGSLMLHGLLMYVGLRLLIRQLETECHLPPSAIARKAEEANPLTTQPFGDDPPEIMVVRSPRTQLMPVVIVPERVPDTKLPPDIQPDRAILPIVIVPKPVQLPPRPKEEEQEVKPLIVVAPPPEAVVSKVAPPEPPKPELPKPEQPKPEPPKPKEAAKVEPPPVPEELPKLPPPPEPAKVAVPPPPPPAPPPPKIEAVPPPPPKAEVVPPQPPPKIAKVEDPPKPPDKQAVPPPPPPPPPPPAKAAPPPKPEDNPEDDLASEIDHFFGRQDGKGTAVNDAPGDKPQQARYGPQDQAALTRNPEGMVRPIERINEPDGKKVAGGGPSGGGGGATPSQAADSTAATVGPGGIASGSNPKPQPAQAGELAPAGVVPKAVDPGKTQVDVPTSPAPGLPLMLGGGGAEKKSSEPIGIAARSKDDKKMFSGDASPGLAIAGGSGGILSDRPIGPDTTERVGLASPRPPQVAIAPNDLMPTPDALQSDGGGAIATLRPTTRSTPTALAAAIGPRELPPGKKNPAPGPPGPGDGPGDGEAPSRSPIKDPATRSESESDAFSSIRADIFRLGGVEAKAGRKVRSVKPRIGDRGMTDLWTYGRLVTVFKLSISEAGKVTNVEVRRPSGSESIDLATRLAIYQWWIEPKKGPDGAPVPDSVTLTIVWH